MSSADLAREWLQTVLRPYPSRDRILPEVLEVLDQRKTLSVKTDAFTFDSGQTALLLLLHGTLPITYRGATYQIPIHLWITYSYPRDPPMAFVVPAREMGVWKGREVEPGGRVREEIVEEWWRSWQEKGIEAVLRQLTTVFSTTPPVYARPPDAAASPAQPPGHPASRLSNGHGSSQGVPLRGAAQPPGPPPPPARPGFGPIDPQTEILPQYRAAPTPQFPYAPLQNFPQSPSREPSGPYPQYPEAQASGSMPRYPTPAQRPAQIPPRHLSQAPVSPTSPRLPQRPHGAAMAQGGPSNQAAQQPIALPIPPVPPALQYPVDPQYQSQPRQPPDVIVNPGQGWSQPANGFSVARIHANLAPYNHPQAVPYQPPAATPQPPFAAPLSRQPQHDLLSSPSNSFSSLPEPSTAATSPPPIPPSKPPPPSLLHLHSILLPHLSASLPPLVHTLQMNRSHLIERHEDLSSGEPAIRDEMARLEAVKKVCNSVGRRMGELVARGEERILEVEGRGEVSVDEVVCGISIVHNQLVDLVAEDNAIEDTIYHMTRAFDMERIDLDRFLKSIRSLAREQYMKRALIERILQGMGQKQDW